MQIYAKANYYFFLQSCSMCRVFLFVLCYFIPQMKPSLVLTQDYTSLSSLDIIVRASLVLHTQSTNMILRTPDTDVRHKMSSGIACEVFFFFLIDCVCCWQVTLTVFPESAVAQYGGVPWWIIVVAVLAGILILALLVCLLWKVSGKHSVKEWKKGKRS